MSPVGIDSPDLSGLPEPQALAWLEPHMLADAQRRALDSHSIVSVCDRSSTIAYVNDRFCDLLGFTREELVGKTYDLINSDVHDQDFFATIRGVVNGGRAWEGEVCNRTKDGAIVWFDNIVVPLFGSDGRVSGHLSVRKNITGRKQAEAALQHSEQFMQDIAALARVGGWSLDLESGKLFWSEETKRIHDVAPDFEPKLDSAINFYAPEARAPITHAVENAINTGESWDLELPMITAKGRSIWVRAVGHAEYKDGNAVRIIGAFQDITQRKLVEDVLRDEVSQRNSAEQLLRDVLETLPDAVAAFDQHDRLIVCNSAYLSTYAISADAIVPGATFEDIARFALARGQFSDTGTSAQEQEAWLQRRINHHRQPSGQLIHRLRDGTWLQVREHRSHNGTTVGVRTDITSLKRAEDELRRYAETDALTGLMNRRSFCMALDDLLEKVAENRHAGGCVALFDLDHFKPINDAYGHDVGDEVLIEIGSRLKSTLGPSDFAARLGGDEFVFVLGGGPDTQTQEEMLKGFFAAVAHPIHTRAGTVVITLSLGLADLRDGSISSRKLLKYADLAQYRAKQEGRATWRRFSQCDVDAITHEHDLAQALGASLRSGKGLEFSLLPIVGSDNGAALGFSNQIGWAHGGETFGANALSALAQSIGQGPRLCSLSMDAAMASIGQAQARGIDTGQLWLSASAEHLKLEAFVATLEAMRERHGLDARSITVAVNAQAFVERSATAIEARFEALSKVGYRLGMDGFGSVACSASLMQRLGIHAVRLAQSLTNPLNDPACDDRLVRALMAMVCALDLEVIASDVASPHHAARLASQGCSGLQGPLLGSAIGSHDVADFLAEAARRKLAALLAPPPAPQSKARLCDDVQVDAA